MKKGKTFLRYAVGIIFSLIYIMPIWMVVVNSFKEKKEANLMGLGLPKTFTLDNYIQIYTGGKFNLYCTCSRITCGICNRKIKK